MKSRASLRSRKRDVLYETALDALERADYALCMELIGLAPLAAEADRGAWALLAARCEKILGNTAEWLASAQIAARECALPGDRALGLAYVAAATTRISGKHAGDVYAERALAVIAGRKASEIGAARYAVATYRWENGDLAGARELALANVRDRVAEFDSMALLGWIAQREERYSVALEHFHDTLRALRASMHPDERLRVNLIATIAVLASETLDFTMGRVALEEFDLVDWSPAHHLAYDSSMNAFRYLALLEGDLEGAYALARRSTAGKRPASYQAGSEVLAAVASRLLGDDRAEALQLQRAWDILRAEKWSQKSDEPRIPLAYFMTEAAERLPAEARKASVLYRSLAPIWDPRDSLQGDRRVVAFEMMAAGRVAELTHDTKRAILAYQASLELWQALGYHMRVAFAALALYRLTGRSSYLKIVRGVTKLAPKAWFASELKKKPLPVEKLTHAERMVLAGIIRGMTAKEIARSLERSVYVVNNNTRKIFDAFGMSSRAKVLATCVALGITPESLERSARA